MRIVAYTYEADVHCPACAARRFAPADKRYCEPQAYGYARRVRGSFGAIERVSLDEHYLYSEATDREGNLVRPIFSTDEHDFTHCGTCREEI